MEMILDNTKKISSTLIKAIKNLFASLPKFKDFITTYAVVLNFIFAGILFMGATFLAFYMADFGAAPFIILIMLVLFAFAGICVYAGMIVYDTMTEGKYVVQNSELDNFTQRRIKELETQYNLVKGKGANAKRKSIKSKIDAYKDLLEDFQKRA